MEAPEQVEQLEVLEYQNLDFSDVEEGILDDFSLSTDTEPNSSVYNEEKSSSASTSPNHNMELDHAFSQLGFESHALNYQPESLPEMTLNCGNARMTDDRKQAGSRRVQNDDDDGLEAKQEVFTGKKKYVQEIAERQSNAGEEGLQAFCQEYGRFVKCSKLRQACKMLNLGGIVNRMLCRARFHSTMTRLQEGYKFYYFDDNGEIEP